MDPIQEQVDAYNERDLARFLFCYSEDIVIEDGKGNPIMVGRDAAAAFYRRLFADSPHLHCDIVHRTKVGSFVIDEESVSGVILDGFPSSMRAVAIYTVEDDQITHARMLW